MLTAVICLALPASAAAGKLDQAQTNYSGTLFFITGPTSVDFSPQSLAQTFTAGRTGAVDQVDLYLKQFSLSNSAGLTVEIRTVSGGVPGGVVLASTTVAPGAIPVNAMAFAFVPVTFSSPAPVTAGSQYAIVAYPGGADEYSWGGSVFNPYAGGAGLFSPAAPPGAWTVQSVFDFAFRTYVVTDQGNQNDQGNQDAQA